MKTIRPLLLSLLAFLGGHGHADAQIRDNESSISTLAIQCAVSSGYSAEGFINYSEDLAKTLSLLTGEQQARVFGFLPRPSGSQPSFDPGDYSDSGPEAAPPDAAPSVVPLPPVSSSPTTSPEPEDNSEDSPTGSDSPGSPGSANSSNGAVSSSQTPVSNEETTAPLDTASIPSTDPDYANKKGKELWDYIMDLVQKIQDKL